MVRCSISKGPGSRAGRGRDGIQLIESAQTRWRAVNAPHLVTLVRAGAGFDKGILIERPDETAAQQQAA